MTPTEDQLLAQSIVDQFGDPNLLAGVDLAFWAAAVSEFVNSNAMPVPEQGSTYDVGGMGRCVAIGPSSQSNRAWVFEMLGAVGPHRYVAVALDANRWEPIEEEDDADTTDL